MVSTTILLLAACGSSDESKIIGSGKTVVDENITSYLEINEERFINRSESVTAEYTMTETHHDNFLLEVINPESGFIDFLFEGYFEDDDKIIVVEAQEGAVENSELIRVDNIAEEMEKEEKKLQEKEEKELEEEENNKSIEDKNKELEAEYGELGTTEYDLEAITEEVTLKSVTDGETVVVQRGFAKVANLSEPNTKYLDEFIEDENEAKHEQLKIWSIEGYVTDDGVDMSVYGR